MSIKTDIRNLALKEPRLTLLTMVALIMASCITNFAYDLLKPACPCMQSGKKTTSASTVGLHNAIDTVAQANLAEKARRVKVMISTQKTFTHEDSVFIYQTWELIKQYNKTHP